MKNKREKAKKIKYISRVENTKYRDHWWIRIHKMGKLYQIRVFDDECEGTDTEILKYATYCRDYLHEILFPGYAVNDRKPAFTTNNDTGIPGIRYIQRRQDGPEYYIVSWTPKGGEVEQKLFAIHKLGDDEAFEQARVFREEMVDKYYKNKQNNRKKS